MAIGVTDGGGRLTGDCRNNNRPADRLQTRSPIQR